MVIDVAIRAALRKTGSPVLTRFSKEEKYEQYD
jgi:hypothetical protein